ncbi:vWA domain-containing protein [Euzebya tangerina]|uniref:vWA domain-containing protein n=1 Tax=Euzebya tangerina TaxID=591198 RepID=UPI000E32063C|nr:VWA domain-containing protein [Euzebya tangerina]
MTAALPTAEGPLDGARVVTDLARALREEGVDVAITSELLATEAVSTVGIADADRLYIAGRAALIHDPEDIPAYNRAFALVFARPVARPLPPLEPPPLRITLNHDDPDTQDRDGGWEVDNRGEDLTLRFSATEVLRRADLATLDEADRAEAQRLIAQLRLDGPWRRGRRHRPARRGPTLDLRRTVGHALATSGEMVRLARTAPAPTLRRLVFVLDVSGSMEPYATALVRFAHVAMTVRSRVEVFAVGTRLSRLTRSLGTHDPDVALAAAAAATPDWAGGTRLGEALAAFNDGWGLRGIARGAVVVIASDGWDRGDPGQIAEQMQRLHRVAHRVVWVNPLAADPRFAPVASGMAAALPHVDDLRPGESVASLQRLADLLADVTGR